MFHYTIKSIALPGDLSTPVSTYLKVRDLFAQSALMESSDYHGSENNRSFIGLEPLASFSVSHGKAIMLYPDKTEHQVDITDSYSVSDAFDDFIKMFSVEGNDSAYCDLYGYTSFNAVRYFEHIDVKDSKEAKNDAPDIHYIMYKYLLVFNDFSSELKLLEMLADGESSHADEIVRAVMSRNYATYTFHAVGPTTSPLTDEEHKANIRRGIAHCKRGDVFQIVLSRRFIQHYEGDDFELYRALRRINPSPYLFYFDFGGFRIFGSSPETHCRIEDNGMAYIDPIAGTTRRQGNTEADAKAAAALLADPKENAEHTMLVDLARNDLNRHCSEVEVEFFEGHTILQPCHSPCEPRQRTCAPRHKCHQTAGGHFPGWHTERRAQSEGTATHQPVRAAQPRSLWRLYRIYRAERHTQPSHHHSFIRQPQWRAVVSSRRRHSGRER